MQTAQITTRISPSRTQPEVETSDLIVFSHLRWKFVFQRPQHLMNRFARHRRVFFFEEPCFGSEQMALKMDIDEDGVCCVIPHLPDGLDASAIERCQRLLLEKLMVDQQINSYSFWYYTPMAFPWTDHLHPQTVVYDCMDELSLFKGAPESLVRIESALLARSNLVFTGGHSLYESKQHLHNNIHPFPSSIDRAHFAQARQKLAEPDDQKFIPAKRMGFFGVIDERMDVELLAGIAQLLPDWNIVMIGPVVKIDPETLPKSSNIYYLGKKDYSELPSYLAGWDVAIMPFARNDSTRFISPTKTPEFLAAGRPVVSTSIRDVIHPYAVEHLVQIADSPEDFAREVLVAQRQPKDLRWLTRVDQFLADKSWDETWQRMAKLEYEVCSHERYNKNQSKNAHLGRITFRSVH